jgi:hypothetical protein
MRQSGRQFHLNYSGNPKRNIIEAMQPVEKNGSIISTQMLKKEVGLYKKRYSSFLLLQSTDVDGL